jgi:hypothetical protein
MDHTQESIFIQEKEERKGFVKCNVLKTVPPQAVTWFACVVEPSWGLEPVLSLFKINDVSYLLKYSVVNMSYTLSLLMFFLRAPSAMVTTVRHCH